jgi:16S rRNA (cytidine1402-2'-O)-methyltransferase
VLVLAGTPIGRPEDAPARLADELVAADVIAAEDTRRLKRLMSALEVHTDARITSYF